MQPRHAVLERLARGQSVVLDGGVAAELVRRGFRPAAPLRDAAASRDAPELLAATHRAYIEAGVDVVTAFTARTTVRALARGGFGMRAAALTTRAVDLAHEAASRADRPVAVAGALGALEDAEPARTPSPRTLADEHSEHAVRLCAAGCDVILVEPMPTLAECLAATAAARAAGAAVWTALALRDRAALSDGTALELAARCTVAVGAQALLVEGLGAAELPSALASLASLALGVPLGARPSRGADREAFAAEITQAMQRGARVIGAASGATPDDVRALAARVRARAAA